MVKSLPLTYKNSVIHYYIFGSGPEILLCFHGYGSNGSRFALLEEKLRSAYTIIAIDFPLHGSTQWLEGLSFSPEDLQNIIDAILATISGQVRSTSCFSVIAYSMGGRVALALLERIPERIQKMVLVAPDGLYFNFWYHISTQTRAGSSLFRYSMREPYIIFNMIAVARKLRLLNSNLLRMINFYVQDENERKLLYKRWMTMRNFKPNLSVVKKILDKKHIPVEVFFGQHDGIIISHKGMALQKCSSVKIKVLNTGHQLLKPRYIPEIISLLSK